MFTLRAAVVGDVYIMTGGVGSWLYMAPEVVRHRLCEIIPSGCAEWHRPPPRAQPVLKMPPANIKHGRA